MKRIMSLILCIVIATLTLVSCGEGFVPGSQLGNYEVDNTDVPEVSLNLYIVTDERTTDNAKTTISRMFSQYTTAEFNTKMTLYYYTAEEYEAAVNSAITEGGDKKPNIVLITSADMINSLVASNSVVDMTNYYTSPNYREFNKLNAQIPAPLIQGSRINSKLYTVPNNHVIGEYTYLVINTEVARDHLKFSPETLSSYKSLEDAAELIAAMQSQGYTEAEIASLVRVTTGGYALKAQLEANGSYCNICVYPTVDANEAHQSAFAIVDSGVESKNDRAMEIIYAINSDEYLRNLLQYGVHGTNYSLDNGKVVRVPATDNNAYYMDLIYTGDVFKALYCEEIGWNATAKQNGLNQNLEAKAAE